MAKKSENKSFVLRVDAATMDALERWADDEFRSINGQLQWIIADALRRSGRLKKAKEESQDKVDNEIK
ncbi:MAG: DNA-binding protein [Alistipes sp.]|nr:DNA-binding protein [Alistipes sp.]MBQ6988363.1 DNA-binding protein [Alistipes sp.]